MSVLPVLVRPVFVPLAPLKRSTDPYLHVPLLAAGKKRGKSVVFKLKNGPGPFDETTTGSKDAPSFASPDLTAADIDAMDAILTDECVFASRPRRFGPSLSSPPFAPLPAPWAASHPPSPRHSPTSLHAVFSAVHLRTPRQGPFLGTPRPRASPTGRQRQRISWCVFVDSSSRYHHH